MPQIYFSNFVALLTHAYWKINVRPSVLVCFSFVWTLTTMDKNMWNWHIHSSFTDNRFGRALHRQLQLVCTPEDMHMYDIPEKELQVWLTDR